MGITMIRPAVNASLVAIAPQLRHHPNPPYTHRSALPRNDPQPAVGPCHSKARQRYNGPASDFQNRSTPLLASK